MSKDDGKFELAERRIEKRNMAEVDSSWRRGPGNEVRFGLRSHALLDTLSTAETTELSGPCYL